jgi:transposase
MGEGRCKKTVEAFLNALGPEQSALLTHVSADGADWIRDVVRHQVPQALTCLDAFHVVKRAREKLDELRRCRAPRARGPGRRARQWNMDATEETAEPDWESAHRPGRHHAGQQAPTRRT